MQRAVITQPPHVPAERAMQHVVILDNYDSFTFNLAQAFGSLGARVTVLRNDAVTLEALERLGPERLVISPGPGGPRGTGICAAAFRRFRGLVPFLGVCLGHQVMAECIGARVARARWPIHGKRAWVHHDGSGIFAGLPEPFVAARYHSLAVERATLPQPIRVAAWSPDEEVMAIGIPGEATWGVQFHPESFMTPAGRDLLRSYLAGVPCP